MDSDPKGKRLALLFFHPSRRQGDEWVCDECNESVKQPGTGYSNLASHIRCNHSELVPERIEKERKKNMSFFQSLTYDAKTLRIHAWLETISMCLLPFSFCEYETIRKHFKHAGICRNTLTKYMHKLVSLVESKISDELPDLFAIVFDGWSAGDTHFVAVYASYQ